ncbi:PP2C family protein-serine/threonine phosphatase [Chondromyces crocatus]|uniref:PPM-type phosphatase domain-containing protein n=1 Tax=Chondromyces crocatus TaxID=52 RepID=A0A0K1EMC2_CHOCO|nr:protein phosphatase 2C domain-containing protein [Chondromyces crocatus]AKT41961.1 uncharacterized protein CMC5_061830 [Chondromyces crocatus]
MMPNLGSSTRLKIDFAQASDPGRDPNKQVNEDSCGVAETGLGHLAVLCDGMGGHHGGREASRTAIQTIFEVVERATPGTPPGATLKVAIEEAGRRVFQLGGPIENRGRPGSTVVAMLLHDRGVDVAHVGDSRAYVIRAGQIYPLTRDHSMVQSLIDAGMITEKQAIGHPDANKITRALGMKPEVDVEVRPESMELYPGDLLLTSSDGLTDLALNDDILGCVRQALASGTLEHACQMLVQMANDRGGHDNITVQLARVVETGGRRMTVPGEPAAIQHAMGPEPTMPATDAPIPAGPTVPWSAAPPTEPEGLAVRPTEVGSPSLADLHPGGGHAPPHRPQMATDGRASRPGHGAHAHLGQYRAEHAPGGLPLPPPATAGYVAAALNGDPARGAHGGAAGPNHGPAVAAHRPHIPDTTLNEAGHRAPERQPPRGGIVLLIIGVSAVIAVLLVMILWAVLPR